MKIEKTEIFGFQAAVRGMRNARESWANSDSRFWRDSPRWGVDAPWGPEIEAPECPLLGVRDIKRMQALICTPGPLGQAERKFMRMIHVWADITVSRYIWQEFDTYKIATVKNSCSTMDAAGRRDLTRADFQDGVVLASVLQELNQIGQYMRDVKGEELNHLRRLYKQHLPEGFLLKATLDLNYETLRTIYFQRRHHRLAEWNVGSAFLDLSICRWIETLPYAPELITFEK